MLHRLSRLLALFALAAVLAPLPLWPHGGGLDQYGCHHNRVHGGYHCHRGVFKGAMFDSRGEMLQQLEQSRRSPTAEKESAPVVVQEFTGRVVGVSDGDTITVLHSGKPVRIRLNGIDSPEKRQPFGKRAKQLTSRLTYGKAVTVEDHGQDRYGRSIGDVILPDGRVLNRELVKAGFAWWYRKYAPENEALAELERGAREAKRGLWAEPDPVPPWEWRTARKRYR